MATSDHQQHPANAVFLLLEDRQFRLSVIKPGIEKERHRLGKLVTGKHQVKGFRTITKAPLSMLLPVISDEASVAPELARALLQHWYDANGELRSIVAAKLKEYGYEPQEQPFDGEGQANWRTMKTAHADMQFEGGFIEGADQNAVMLMSLLLGWLGANDDESAPSENDA